MTKHLYKDGAKDKELEIFRKKYGKNAKKVYYGVIEKLKHKAKARAKAKPKKKLTAKGRACSICHQKKK